MSYHSVFNKFKETKNKVPKKAVTGQKFRRLKRKKGPSKLVICSTVPNTETALALWISAPIFWRRKSITRESPVCSLMRFPIWSRMSIADGPHEPNVSKPISEVKLMCQVCIFLVLQLFSMLRGGSSQLARLLFVGLWQRINTSHVPCHTFAIFPGKLSHSMANWVIPSGRVRFLYWSPEGSA